ncbi:MAG: aminoacyl-tRNA hydrolase [Rhodospirillales bacterium]
MAAPAWLLAGLGNPGREYAGNRHNIGFMAADAICERHRFAPSRSRFLGATREGRIGGSEVLVLKPMTFMNDSGRSVAAAVRFFKLDLDRLIVFHDELDLAAGKVRVKRGGGAAGHNGIRSIDAHLGPDFWRVRLGIGHPGAKTKVLGHVLKDFAASDGEWLPPLLDRIGEHVGLLLAGDAPAFMSKVAPPPPPRPKPADERKGVGGGAGNGATGNDGGGPPGGN